MDIQSIKLELIKMRLIKAVLATEEFPILEQLEQLLFPEQATEEIPDEQIKELGYWLNGEPVTAKSILQRLIKMEKDKQAGKMKDHEEFMNEAENW